MSKIALQLYFKDNKMRNNKLKDKLTEAFKDLRKKGYFARQNFLCCQSCGWASVPEGKSDKVVFYHSQDKSDLEKTGSCHLAWDGDGNEIVEVMKQHGIKTEWDGTKGQRIKITI